MSFASWTFLGLFLPAVLAIFYTISGRNAAGLRQAWLIAASLLFYGASGLTNLAVLSGSIALNYTAGVLLGRDLTRGRRKMLLWFAVSVDIGLLLSFKWWALQSDDFGGFLSTPRILIPLALSFITFEQIAFLTACYRGRVKRPDFFSYLFFISFFPRLIMGPIVQYREISDQLSAGALARRSFDNVAVGFSIFMFGLAKKVLLADPLAGPVDALFSRAAQGENIAFTDAWFAVVAFYLQLFLDFSGYADMAIGLGRMFGMNLPINFDRPSHAVDRFDFWRRWHITFAMFMRNNVFIPLVRHAKFPPLAALAVTGMLSGLWHGLGWTFVVWGAVQTAIMMVAHVTGKRRRRHLANRSRLRLSSAIAATFLVTCLLAVLFRAPNWTAAGEIYGSLLDPEQELSWLRAQDLVALVLAFCAIWLWPDTSRFFGKYWTAIDQRGERPQGDPSPTGLRIRFTLSHGWAVAFGLLVILVALEVGDARRFVYVQF